MREIFENQTNPNNMYIHFWELAETIGCTKKGTKIIKEHEPVYGKMKDAIAEYHQQEQDGFKYVNTLAVSNDKVTCKFFNIEEIIQEIDAEENPEKYSKDGF